MKVALVLAILIAVVCVIESKKHWKKKDFMKSKKHPSADPFHKGFKHDRRGQRKHFGTKQMKSLSVHDDEWLKLPHMRYFKDCQTVCPKRHICIKTNTGIEKCVTKHYIREGRRLFKHFHEQKEFLKKDTVGNPDLTKKLDKAERIKEGYEMYKQFKGSKKDGKGSHPLKGDNPKEVYQGHKDLRYTLDQAEKVQNAYEKYHGGKGKSQGHLKEKVEKPIIEIIPIEMTGPIEEKKDCNPHDMHSIRKRLNGWFVMLHTQKRQNHHLHKEHPRAMKATVTHKRLRREAGFNAAIDTESHGHCKCSKSVMWEFRHLDENLDHHLSNTELKVIEENHNEACIRPFLDSIDLDKDNKLSKQEWCCSLADVVPPCFERLRKIDPKSSKDWIPRCDTEGYYQREQCDDHSGDCWCADLDGNEIHGTRKQGNAHCGHFDPLGHKIQM